MCGYSKYKWREKRVPLENIDGRYSNRHHVASFSGFSADQPELVITVVVDEPKLKGLAMAEQWQRPHFEELLKLVFSTWVFVLQISLQT